VAGPRRSSTPTPPRRLLHLRRTYPAEPFLAAVAQALTYGLYDLDRLESLVLKQVCGAFFQFPED
jgi:hypothetical protein